MKSFRKEQLDFAINKLTFYFTLYIPFGILCKTNKFPTVYLIPVPPDSKLTADAMPLLFFLESPIFVKKRFYKNYMVYFT